MTANKFESRVAPTYGSPIERLKRLSKVEHEWLDHTRTARDELASLESIFNLRSAQNLLKASQNIPDAHGLDRLTWLHESARALVTMAGCTPALADGREKTLNHLLKAAIKRLDVAILAQTKELHELDAIIVESALNDFKSHMADWLCQPSK